ncbi:hypothetical protein EUGRSUZ_C02084, partial [Eucalyptus grandis]
MKKAWRVDYVDISANDSGLYIIKCRSETEKRRILDGCPWLFSGHLVNLRPWQPKTPLHCYDFSKCPFWVHVIGLPLEWNTPQLLSRAVQHMGRVLEIKPDSSGRVRIELDLQTPLTSGKLISIAGKALWIDFRYEKLSHFCFSCGKLGHYAASCKEFPYDETQFDGRETM